MKIAIIDDNEELAYNISDNLELEYDADCIVYSDKSSYLSFLAHIRDIMWDCLIIDYNLEEKINGVRIAELVRNDGFKGPIVFVTGEGGLSVENEIERKIDNSFYVQKGNDLQEDIFKLIDEKFN